MRILHIAPHLGGGVGKAHATLGAVLPQEVERTFVLLEAPKDTRYVKVLEAGGARIVVAESLGHISALAAEADIVQFEFWNHPRLFECLARCAFPAIRGVFWSHISGLFRPLIPLGLIEQASRFVFTTQASWSMAGLPVETRRKISTINSGFGFTDRDRRISRGPAPAIAYLGTVDFVKMHPCFFEVVDRLRGDDIHADVWGSVDSTSDVAGRARAMRHPERIRFGGQTSDPAAALSAADVFFYPLQPDHYGSAENALIEAMSLGLVPVVLDNPAERAIIRHGENGLLARSVEQCVEHLQLLLRSPGIRETLSRNAVRYVTDTKEADRSARQFVELWRALLSESPARPDFKCVVGDDPASWFAATQCLPGESWEPANEPAARSPSKGTLAHFQSVFPGDVSWSRPPIRGPRGPRSFV
jgi:glycosyltransferase involved in cell wall biosynthesis